MVRSLIALLITVAITITGFIEPAYAVSNPSMTESINNLKNNGNNNTYQIENSFNHNYYGEREDFSDKLVKRAVEGATFIAGMTAACYTLDFTVSLFIPPAIAASSVCGYIPGAAASGEAIRVFAGAR